MPQNVATPRLSAEASAAGGRGSCHCTLQLPSFLADLWSSEWACGLADRKPSGSTCARLASPEAAEDPKKSARSRRLSTSFAAPELRASDDIHVDIVDASNEKLQSPDDGGDFETNSGDEGTMFQKDEDKELYARELQSCEGALKEYKRAMKKSSPTATSSGDFGVPRLRLAGAQSARIGGVYTVGDFGDASTSFGASSRAPPPRRRSGEDAQLVAETPQTLMLSKRYLKQVSDVNSSGRDLDHGDLDHGDHEHEHDASELSDEELYLDRRYSAIARRIGRIQHRDPLPDLEQKEGRALLTDYQSNMTHKFDSMGIQQPHTRQRKAKPHSKSPRKGPHRREEKEKNFSEAVNLVKRGVRDYHAHCITLNSFYATPSATRPEEGAVFTHLHRHEHEECHKVLHEPALNMQGLKVTDAMGRTIGSTSV